MTATVDATDSAKNAMKSSCRTATDHATKHYATDADFSQSSECRVAPYPRGCDSATDINSTMEIEPGMNRKQMARTKRKPEIEPPPLTGRPSKYTPQLAAEICDRMANGKGLREICSAPDMPNRSTVLR